MAEYPFYERQVYPSIKVMLEDVGAKYAGNIAYEYWEKKKVVSKTYQDFYEDICAFSSFLAEKELLGKHIALIGKTSYMWLVSYFATIASGSVVVPIDKELDKDSILEQLHVADVNAVLCEKPFAKVAEEYRESSEICDQVYGLSIDLPGMLENVKTAQTAELAEDEKGTANCKAKVEGLSTVITTREGTDPKDLSAIVFTSGTSGKSKAVMLSQENIVTDGCCVTMVVNQSEKSIALSVLPTNHMFEIASSIMCALYFGAKLCINDSLRNIKKNLMEFKPNVLVVVPLFVDTFYKEIIGTIKKKRLTVPFTILRYISIGLKKCHIDMSRKLFKSIHESFGGNLEELICGGAMLDQKKIDFFQSIGICVFQGYGITECAPAVACNTDRYAKKGAVGKVLPCCEVKVVDGEIAVKGSNVMLGYYKDPAATAEAIRDGWFYTGDLGYMDEDKFVYLTGRKKNLIILSNGENVSPEEIEFKLQEIEQIKELVVSGEDGVVCAEIYYGTEDAELETLIKNEIANRTKKWPIYKQPKKIKFRYEEFEKTTTKKIKRK